jgi:hypothetical protein
MSASMSLSKYAADDRGQENQRGGQEQSDCNLSSQSNEPSGSRPARLTARIEFGGTQFLLRGIETKRTAYNTCACCGQPQEWTVSPVPQREHLFEL